MGKVSRRWAVLYTAYVCALWGLLFMEEMAAQNAGIVGAALGATALLAAAGALVALVLAGFAWAGRGDR